MFRATGTSQRLFPAFHSAELFREGSGTRRRLRQGMRRRHPHAAGGGRRWKMKPASPLTEPLVVRPTSETIIGASYARWVQSYRDLANPDQSMGKRRPLGNAAAPVSADNGISLAGRPHRPRNGS